MKNLRPIFCMILLLPFILYNCTTEQDSGNSGAYVTLLGSDTMAVESFSFGDDGVEATVILRSPRTSLTTYQLVFNESAGLASLETKNYGTDLPAEGSLVSERSITTEGDSLKLVFPRNGEIQERMMAAEPNALPFIDMIHWPFELVLKKMKEEGKTNLSQPLIAGTRTRPFVFNMIGSDSFSLQHPSRGTMFGKVGENGELLSLDASKTTRKLTVNRVDELDIPGLLERFKKLEEAGKGIGPLSGAAKTESSVQGANFVVTFGQPSKRGRELFGGIVPWNQRWRTGANRATHFSTDKDLTIGELEVPAGDYTLFTIPAPDGGTLIINKQTGQNGRSYKEEMDLGRVPMAISNGNPEVELFTIDVVEKEEGGAIQLKWGGTMFEVPFVVK